MAESGIQHLALGIALAAISAGCSAWKLPVVVKVAHTINNAETVSSKDYERLREVTEEAIDHIKGVDPTSARNSPCPARKTSLMKSPIKPAAVLARIC